MGSDGISEITMIIIVVVIFIILVGGIILLYTGRGKELLSSITNLMRFGR